jgi:carboxylate-amine ligase
LRQAAPDGSGDPSIALLSDGPSNGAWYEHRTLALRLGIPIVEPSRLCNSRGALKVTLPSGRLREIQVLYRRTDEDRLRDEHGRPTWLAELLLDPVRRGTLSVVNSFGTGVADDKLLHAYVEEMVRFYLGEAPLIESVRTYDLGQPHWRTRALGRLSALVVKPRAGHGGHGVMIGSHASERDRELAARQIKLEPERFVAQETVQLSRHPTICGNGLEPRHVDLRVFAIGSGAEIQLSPAALTRVALTRGSLIVNTSQTGGGKDTWVLS